MFRVATVGMPVVAVVLGVTAMVASCSDTDRSANRFCGELNRSLSDLTAEPVDGNDVDGLVTRFRQLNGITPIAIQDEWQALTDLV